MFSALCEILVSLKPNQLVSRPGDLGLDAEGAINLEASYERDWRSETIYWMDYRSVPASREPLCMFLHMCSFWEYMFSFAPGLDLGTGTSSSLMSRQQERKDLCPKAFGFASSWLTLHAQQPLCSFPQSFLSSFLNLFQNLL